MFDQSKLCFKNYWRCRQSHLTPNSAALLRLSPRRLATDCCGVEVRVEVQHDVGQLINCSDEEVLSCFNPEV